MGCHEMKDKKKEPPKKSINPEQKETNIPHEDIDKNKGKTKSSKNNANDDKENQKLKSNPNKNEKKENLLIIDEKEYIPDYIGKLCFEPLLLFIYECRKNTFQVKKYNQSLISFEKINNTCSYCNGDNKLFVSGGIDSEENILDKLWIFDLIDYQVEYSIQISPKKNHSMIYIPKNYIFFVGGNDNKVFYLDIHEKQIKYWKDLNQKRIEPALIQVNNYLYIFDNINQGENNHDSELSFERTNLLTSQQKWELIKPKLSQEVVEKNIIPKYFGVAKETENKIIFIGGNLLNEQNNNEDSKYYKYDIEENIINFSDVPFVNIQLNEKCFLNFNNKNNIYFILPDFHKNCPQVAFYIKNKNELKVVDYLPNENNEEKKIPDTNLNIKKENNNAFKKYDFNMPKTSVRINEIVEI